MAAHLRGQQPFRGRYARLLAPLACLHHGLAARWGVPPVEPLSTDGLSGVRGPAGAGLVRGVPGPGRYHRAYGVHAPSVVPGLRDGRGLGNAPPGPASGCSAASRPACWDRLGAVRFSHRACPALLQRDQCGLVALAALVVAGVVGTSRMAAGVAHLPVRSPAAGGWEPHLSAHRELPAARPVRPAGLASSRSSPVAPARTCGGGGPGDREHGARCFPGLVAGGAHHGPFRRAGHRTGAGEPLHAESPRIVRASRHHRCQARSTGHRSGHGQCLRGPYRAGTGPGGAGWQAAWTAGGDRRLRCRRVHGIVRRPHPGAWSSLALGAGP